MASRDHSGMLDTGEELRKQMVLAAKIDNAIRPRPQRLKGRHSAGAIYLSSGQQGAISEMLVSVDLMARGWDVFRAVSPHASCDLVAVNGQRALRVEVTGSDRRGDKIKERHRWDVLAMVHNGTSVIYEPALPVVPYEPRPRKTTPHKPYHPKGCRCGACQALLKQC
jgi:hypothetical protein